MLSTQPFPELCTNCQQGVTHHELGIAMLKTKLAHEEDASLTLIAALAHLQRDNLAQHGRVRAKEINRFLNLCVSPALGDNSTLKRDAKQGAPIKRLRSSGRSDTRVLLRSRPLQFFLGKKVQRYVCCFDLLLGSSIRNSIGFAA